MLHLNLIFSNVDIDLLVFSFFFISYFCCTYGRKYLLNLKILDICRAIAKGKALPSLHFHNHEDKLKCPYKGCEKSFERPAVVTDRNGLVRQSFYACPHCQSKIDLIIEGTKVVEIKPIEYPKVFDSPAKCAHYSGFLDALSRDMTLPEECLVCPKVLQCSIRRQK